jgi:phage-related protein
MASFLDTVKSALSKTGDAIKQKTSEIGNAVVNTAVDAKNKVGSAVNTASDFVSFVSDDVGKRASQTGKDIV